MAKSEAAAGEMGTIVVGVDGSPGSDAALRWALDEARLRGSRLRVVHAYEAPHVALSDVAVGAAGIPTPPVLAQVDVERVRASAEEQARSVIDSALRRVAREGGERAEIERAALVGPAAQTLIEAGRDAELLVLGSRGRGGFLGLLLGSVTQQCAHHPPCPVVILPPPEQDEPA
jgi:nucleotide-binding universal stress UspA family protein